MEYIKYTGIAFVSLGTAFLLLGAIGVFRMPDVYSRMQAGTKATTLGAMSFILGIGLLQPQWLGKSIIIVAFIALSNPISSHALARAAHRMGIFPWSKDSTDLYRADGHGGAKTQSGE